MAQHAHTTPPPSARRRQPGEQLGKLYGKRPEHIFPPGQHPAEQPDRPLSPIPSLPPKDDRRPDTSEVSRRYSAKLTRISEGPPLPLERLQRLRLPATEHWVPSPLVPTYRRLQVPPAVTVHQPDCAPFEGRALGAMVSRGIIHHYRVETPAGALYLVPPAWIDIPPALPAADEVSA